MGFTSRRVGKTRWPPPALYLTSFADVAAGPHPLPLSNVMKKSRSVSPMIRAYIICESMRPGTSLSDLRATLVRIKRDTQANATAIQPKVWTLVSFETSLDPEGLASKFADILDDNPSAWYSHFRAGEEMFVVFPHRVFRYRVGDKAGRGRAQDYARSIGVPQIDWGEK